MNIVESQKKILLNSQLSLSQLNRQKTNRKN